MANRSFLRDWGSLTRRLVSLVGSFTTSTSGTIATSSAPGEGIKSIARTAAGRYLVTLNDNYKGILSVDANVFVSGTGAYGAAKAVNGYIIRQASPTASGGATFSLQFVGGSNADTDIDDGASVTMIITCRDS